MGKLAKMFGTDLIIAPNFVHAPGYSLYTADQTTEGFVQDGWNYYAEDVEPEDFALPWKQPTDATNTYQAGAVVTHNGQKWRSSTNNNVWEPGVSGWLDVTTGMPTWVQPTGAHDAYPKDMLVAHSGKVWRSLVEANVWEPGVSAWREAILDPPSDTPSYAAWIQPTGAHDAYSLGDRVTHNGFTWESTVNNNVWAPGVYGWIQV
jgi:hypothetical protein